MKNDIRWDILQASVPDSSHDERIGVCRSEDVLLSERAMELSPQKEVGVYCWRAENGARALPGCWIRRIQDDIAERRIQGRQAIFFNQLERP